MGACSVSSLRIVGRSTFAEMLQMPGVSVVLDPVSWMVASQSQETQSAQTTLTVSAIFCIQRLAFLLLLPRMASYVRHECLGVPYFRRLQRLGQMQRQGVWLPWQSLRARVRQCK